MILNYQEKSPDLGLIQDHILNTLDTTAAHVYWKDKLGHYLGTNNNMLNYNAFSSYGDIIGSTDFDHSWAEQAPIWRKNDLEVINTGISKKCIEPCKKDNQIVLFISHKEPLRSKTGKIIGVLGTSILLNRKKPFFSNIHPDGLSKRQAQCIYYLMRGKTAKEIAKILHLSSRTIEHYLDSVKIQWNCSSRSELIEKAFISFEAFHSSFQLMKLLPET